MESNSPSKRSGKRSRRQTAKSERGLAALASLLTTLGAAVDALSALPRVSGGRVRERRAISEGAGKAAAPKAPATSKQIGKTARAHTRKSLASSSGAVAKRPARTRA